MLYSTLHTNPSLNMDPGVTAASHERNHRVLITNVTQCRQLELTEKASRSMIEDECTDMLFALAERIKAVFGPYFLKEREGTDYFTQKQKLRGYQTHFIDYSVPKKALRSGLQAMSASQLFGPLQQPTMDKVLSAAQVKSANTLPTLEGAFVPENWSRGHFIPQVVALPPVKQLHHEQMEQMNADRQEQLLFKNSSAPNRNVAARDGVSSARVLQQLQSQALRAASASAQKLATDAETSNLPMHLRSPVRPDSGIRLPAGSARGGGRKVILTAATHGGEEPQQLSPKKYTSTQQTQVAIYDPEAERRRAKDEQLKRLVIERDQYIAQQQLAAFRRESEAEKDYYRTFYLEERKRTEKEANARELAVMQRRNEQDSMFAAKAFVAGWERRERTELEHEFETVIVPQLWQIKNQVLEEGRRAEYEAFLNTDEQKELAAQRAREEKLQQSNEAKRRAAFEKEQYTLVHDCKHSRSHQSVFIGSLAKKMCLMCKVKFDEKLGIYVRMR